jgi:hypothetical protein
MAGMVDPYTSLPKIYQNENLENYCVASMAGMSIIQNISNKNLESYSVASMAGMVDT